MNHNSLRVGITAILCALVFRFFTADTLTAIRDFLNQPNTQAFLIYLETGRDVRFSSSRELVLDYAPESPPPWLLPTEPPVPVYAEEPPVPMYYGCRLRPDLEALMAKPLQWNLKSGEPTVLILHTHTTESYTRGDLPYKETAAYRTLDEQYNMLSVGDAVAAELESQGIVTLHDRTFHDYPSYNGSYGRSRKTLRNLLLEHPTVRLVLDLHRDACDSGWGGQMKTRATIEGQSAAQLMLVLGTDAGGLKHPKWEENLALGLKLHAQLERQSPGIMRPLSLRSQRFNQDLCPGTLLVEVGSAGNTLAEALPAARQLALGIGALARGANLTEDGEEPENAPVPMPGSPGPGPDSPPQS